MRHGRGLRVALMATSFTQLGCSFLFLETAPHPDDRPIDRPVNQPIDRPVKRPFRAIDDDGCTERNTLPGVDTAVAGVTAGLALLSLGPPSQGTGAASGHETLRGIVVGSALVYAGISAVSAMWGVYHMHECRNYLSPPLKDEPAVEPTPQ